MCCACIPPPRHCVALASRLSRAAWAVGVLLAMLCGSRSASPFDSEADWTRGTLTVEQAVRDADVGLAPPSTCTARTQPRLHPSRPHPQVRTQITAVQADYGGFLLGLDAGSAGFVFRHGWVVRLLLGLLAEDPTQRLTVHQAWEIATEATAGTVPLGAPEFAADELGAAAPLGSPALAPDGPTDAAATAAAEERSTSSAEAVDDAKVALIRMAGVPTALPPLGERRAERIPEQPPQQQQQPPPSPSPPPSQQQQQQRPPQRPPLSPQQQRRRQPPQQPRGQQQQPRGQQQQPRGQQQEQPPQPQQQRRLLRRPAGGGVSASDERNAQAPRPNELERFRSLAAKDSSGEPFRSLEAMLNIADRGGAYISIQRRPWPGVKNYGEVIGFRNRADGDRWDVFVPGLSEELPEGEPLPLRKVLGVVLVKGGNHKLAVELHPPYALDEAAKEQVALDIKAFTTAYVQTHTVSAARVKYLALDELDY